MKVIVSSDSETTGKFASMVQAFPTSGAEAFWTSAADLDN
jgi:hypothetical protein